MKIINKREINFKLNLKLQKNILILKRCALAWQYDLHI